MPNIKAVSNGYSSRSDICSLIRYAIRLDRCMSGFWGVQGLCRGTAEQMAGQMWEVKKLYGQGRGRMLLHYILSFSGQEMQAIGHREALWTGYGTAALFPGHQAVWGVHDNTDNLHVHLVVNTTSYETGRQLSVGPGDLQGIIRQVNEIAGEYIRQGKPVQANAGGAGQTTLEPGR